jgi:hypothetical protein
MDFFFLEEIKEVLMILIFRIAQFQVYPDDLPFLENIFEI